MAFRINPALERFHEEGTLVGLILSSFGELELTVCMCANAAIQAKENSVLRTLYRLRNTSSRIDVADGLMKPIYEQHGLVAEYDHALGRVRACLAIRNQFAHCNWVDHPEGGLFFADLQTSAKNRNFEHSLKHVDPLLLNVQLDFFSVTLQWLRFADRELAVKQGKLQYHGEPRPQESPPPPLHNLASQHVPPWLNEELREVHLRRALESERAAQPQEPPPRVLRLTREEWAAKDAKEAREAAAEKR